jgi:hypothetical protein
MRAILKLALLDFMNHYHANNACFRNAQNWLFRRNTDWLFDFETVCAVLELSAGKIRTLLMHWAEQERAGVPTIQHRVRTAVAPGREDSGKRLKRRRNYSNFERNWRRERDLNPRYPFGVHTLSRSQRGKSKNPKRR